MPEGPVTLIVSSGCGELRRQVGANGWVVLEELLLGSALDDTMAVSRATVRALASRTGLSKDTVSRAIQKLRRAHVLDVEAERHDESGRFVSVRYLLDLSRLPLVVHNSAVATPASTRSPSAGRVAPVKEGPQLARRVTGGRAAQASLPGAEQLRMLGD